MNPALKLYSSIDYGICLADEKCNVWFANQFLLGLLGFAQEELKGMNFNDLAVEKPSDQLEQLEAEFEKKSIDFYHIERRYCKKNKEAIWLKLKISRLNKIFPEESGVLIEATETTPLRIAKETGNELLKSYKDLFDASNDLAFILSQTGEIIDLNQVALDYFEKNPSDIIGTSIIQYASEDRTDISQIKTALEEAWQGQPQRFDWWTIVEQETTPQEVVISKAAYLGEQVLIASFRDIHERIASENRIHEQEALLRLVTENSTDAVSLFDADQSLVYMSPVIEKMIGFTPNELSEIGFDDLIHPEDKKQVEKEITTSISLQKSDSRYKYRQKRKDGSYCWLEVNALRRYDNDGRIIQTIANLRDVNEQVEADTKLKESERFLAETQRLAQIGSWEYDLENKNYKFSLGLLNLLQAHGQKEHDMNLLLDKVCAEHKDLLEEKIKDLEENGIGYNIDFTIELEKEKKRSFNGIGYAERNSEGVISRVRGAVIDITKRKSTELVLRNLKDRAERAAEVKQQFLSNMSHELRTPLNAVLGMTNLLKVENPRQDQLEKIRLLEYSAENLLNIINDILDFSAIEEQQLQLNSDVFELDLLMNNVIHLFTEKARENQTELKLVMENTPRQVIADKFRLNQILFNLIGNAIKFTDEGKVTVTVKGIEGDKPALEFSIADTGIGIEASELGDIFDRFYQSEVGRSFHHAGTGLGLSITKGLLELMGSKIELSSKVGVGTTFTFKIEVDLPELDQVEEPTGVYDSSAKALSDLRVLVAEDNTINQFVVKKILARWNIEPTIVENGQEVLDIILTEQESFDVILLDLQMPIMDGIEAAEKLRAKNVRIPIIAITAAVLPDQREHVLASGMDDFIGKPFKPEELKKIILKHTIKTDS